MSGFGRRFLRHITTRNRFQLIAQPDAALMLEAPGRDEAEFQKFRYNLDDPRTGHLEIGRDPFLAGPAFAVLIGIRAEHRQDCQFIPAHIRQAEPPGKKPPEPLLTNRQAGLIHEHRHGILHHEPKRMCEFRPDPDAKPYSWKLNEFPCLRSCNTLEPIPVVRCIVRRALIYQTFLS
jgi:hypothetical protein